MIGSADIFVPKMKNLLRGTFGEEIFKDKACREGWGVGYGRGNVRGETGLGDGWERRGGPKNYITVACLHFRETLILKLRTV